MILILIFITILIIPVQPLVFKSGNHRLKELTSFSHILNDPKEDKSFQNSFEESVWVVKEYYFGNETATSIESRADTYRTQISSIGVTEATKRFLASFSDKYTKFIPKDFFDSKMNSYYGAENGIGLKLSRSLSVPFDLEYIAKLIKTCSSGSSFLSLCSGVLWPVRVSEVVSGGPASAAGLQEGTLVTHIDDRSVTDSSIAQLSKCLLDGDIGSNVTLSTMSYNVTDRLFSRRTFSIERESVPVESVLVSRLPSNVSGLHLLRILEFSESTATEIHAKCASLQRSQHIRSDDPATVAGVTSWSPMRRIRRLCAPWLHRASHRVSQCEGTGGEALAIDLRGNRGGSMSGALDAAALFLPADSPMLEVVAAPALLRTTQTRSLLDSLLRPAQLPDATASVIVRSLNRHPLEDLNLLLLVDQHTASAAEIFAVALMSNKRAVCAGGVTLGKDVAQVLRRLRDGDGMSYTIAKFCSGGPRTVSLCGGITPDLQVDCSAVASAGTAAQATTLSFDSKSNCWWVAGQPVRASG